MSVSPSEDQVDFPNEVNMSLVDHLKELYKRLVHSIILICIFTVVGIYFSDIIYDFIVQNAIPDEIETVSFNPTYPFFMTLKIGFLGGLFCSIPMIAYQVFAFIQPAMKKKENTFVLVTLIGGWLLLISSIFFTNKVIPFFIEVLLSYNPEGVKVEANIQEWVGFILSVYVGFSVLFQVPLVIFLTISLNFVSSEFYKTNRRWVIVILMALSAIFSPADPYSMFVVFVPVYTLFEVAVLLGGTVQRLTCSD